MPIPAGPRPGTGPPYSVRSPTACERYPDATAEEVAARLLGERMRRGGLLVSAPVFYTCARGGG